MGKYTAHTIYKTKDGKKVPGTTTITGVMDKPALKYWANDIGLQGIDIRKYVDTLADAGTLAHKMIECHLKNVKCNTDEYSKTDIDLAENSFIKFLEWEKEKGFIFLASELRLVSEKYKFGGTIDAVYKNGDKLLLVDFKTSKGVYSEMMTQVAGGYNILYEENYNKIDECWILRIGRTEDEGFEFQQIYKTELHKKRFLTCLKLYDLNKKLK